MAPLASLDLFSGIGGIAYALRGIATPIAFVEIDPDARAVLKARMKDGSLARAKIAEDVRTYDARPLRGKVQLVTAGWPCTGFSVAGARKGFADQGSGLFVEVLRIVSECKPLLVFLENSHTLARLENLRRIVRQLADAGYDLRWVTLHATAVGAPHRRHRWFALAVRRGANLPTLTNVTAGYKRFDWSKDTIPRQIPKNTPENKVRLRLLGNGVVPDQVRLAFIALYDGLSTLDPKMLRQPCISFKHPVQKQRTREKVVQRTPIGFTTKAEILPVDLVEPCAKPLNMMMIDKGQHAHRDRAFKYGNIIGRKRLAYWATPVRDYGSADYPSASCCASLTQRSSRHLPVQITYVSSRKASGYLSATWVEWLMGFNTDWTNLE